MEGAGGLGGAAALAERLANVLGLHPQLAAHLTHLLLVDPAVAFGLQLLGEREDIRERSALNGARPLFVGGQPAKLHPVSSGVPPSPTQRPAVERRGRSTKRSAQRRARAATRPSADPNGQREISEKKT